MSIWCQIVEYFHFDEESFCLQGSILHHCLILGKQADLYDQVFLLLTILFTLRFEFCWQTLNSTIEHVVFIFITYFFFFSIDIFYLASFCKVINLVAVKTYLAIVWDL